MMYCDNYDTTYPRNRSFLNSIPDGVRVAPHIWKCALNPYVNSRDAWRCPANGANNLGYPPPLNAHYPRSAYFNPLTVHPAFVRPLHGEVAGRSLARVFTTRTDRSRNP